MQSVLLPLRTSKVAVDICCVFLPATPVASQLLDAKENFAYFFFQLPPLMRHSYVILHSNPPCGYVFSIMKLFHCLKTQHSQNKLKIVNQ